MGNGVHARVRPDSTGHGQAATPSDDTTLQGAYERHRDRVFDLCYHYLGQVADAEDAVQETFARAARRLPTLTGDRGAYLLAVARNLCCNELRRRRRVVPVDSIDREDRGVEAERGIVERAVLERLWVRLSPRERSLIHDTYAGFSQQEIAGRIGLSPNAVAVALLRARQRARTYASRALAAFFPLALAWRWTPRAARRAATVPAEAGSAIALQIQQVGMVLTAAIVGSLTAAPAVAGSVALAGANLPSHAGAAVADASPAVASTATGAAPRGTENALPPASSAVGGAGAASVLDPLVDPGRNAPPSQVWFTSFTPSPDYSNDHTVYASGFYAHDCSTPTGCPVLYVSHDGGATWSNTNAVGFEGGRLMLPPSWPQDRTMFAMGGQGLQRSDNGSVFYPAVPVVAPASIAPDSAPGNARVLIATNPMLIYSAAGKGTVTQGPVLPPGLDSPTDAAFLGDSQHIEVTGATIATQGATGGNRTGAIAQCVGATCTVVETTPNVAMFHFLVSPRFAADRTVDAVSSATVLESTDGGATFSAAPAVLPSGAPTVASLGQQSGATALVLASFSDNKQVVVQLTSSGSAADVPTAGLPTSAPLGALLVLPDGRLLAAAPSSTTRDGVLSLSPGASAWVASN